MAWILEKQDSDDIRADVMNLCDTTARTPGKKVQHAKQAAKGRKISRDEDEEYCGHDGVPGAPDGTDLNTRRPTRERNQTQTFNPAYDGANDGAQQAEGNKCRCYDWLNDIPTCHTKS